MKEKKIAIYYDTFVKAGAAQKVMASLANELNADIVTAGFDPKLKKKLKIKNHVVDLGNFSIKYNYTIGSLIEAPIRFLFSNMMKQYSLHIFSGVYSFYAAKNDTNTIWYSFTPNRILYDLKHWKLTNSGLIESLFYKFINMMFYRLDQYFVKNRIKKIVSQTETIKIRIKRYYGLNSEIIFSPVDTKKFFFARVGDFYLAVSRLIPEKRMSVIAKSFLNLPDEKLILVGSGPEEEKIKRLIKGNKNIKLLTNVGDDELKQLYSECKAVIYIPVDEDFGLVPVEAMASGKLCIASDEGGCKETIIDGATGYLIKPTEKALINAIRSINLKNLKVQKEKCINRAQLFDNKRIFRHWKKVVNSEL